MIGPATRLGTAILLASVLLSSTMPADATLKLCQGATVSGKGRGPTGAIAFDKAKIDWRIRTEDAFGSYFADWSVAENHVRHCGNKEGIVYCRIWGQPCKSTKPTSPSMQD